MYGSGIRLFCNSLSCRINDTCLESDDSTFGNAIDFRADSDCRIVFSDVWGCDICSPNRHMDLGEGDMSDLPV